MNSDKSDIIIILPNLQNLDFHLTKVLDDKKYRKEEKEMERTFRLKNENYSFDKKGMILRGEMMHDGKGILVRARDMYLDNKDIMSNDEVIDCFARGINYKWPYRISELESLNPIIPLSKLEYELLKYCIEHGYQYIARDDNTNLFAYDTTPSKLRSQWEVTKKVKRIYFDDLFSFIKWEDEEPTLIQDILDKYEVIENEKI